MDDSQTIALLIRHSIFDRPQYGLRGRAMIARCCPVYEVRWLSGRKRRTRNAVCQQWYLGFESLTHLHRQYGSASAAGRRRDPRSPPFSAIMQQMRPVWLMFLGQQAVLSSGNDASGSEAVQQRPILQRFSGPDARCPDPREANRARRRFSDRQYRSRQPPRQFAGAI